MNRSSIRSRLGLEGGVAGQDGDALAVLQAFDAPDHDDIAGVDRAIDGDQVAVGGEGGDGDAFGGGPEEFAGALATLLHP